MENSKNKKPKVVCEKITSKFVFTIPIILCLGILVYIINGKLDTNLLIYLVILLGISLKFFLLYYKKKFVLTDKKIYVMVRDKKFISWSLEQDFHMINYSQSKFGKFFDFGTLTIINKNKEMYEYHFIENPKETYDCVIETYEKLMKKLDPNFIVSYKDSSVIENNLDKI